MKGYEASAAYGSKVYTTDGGKSWCGRLAFKGALHHLGTLRTEFQAAEVLAWYYDKPSIVGDGLGNLVRFEMWS